MVYEGSGEKLKENGLDKSLPCLEEENNGRLQTNFD